MKIPKSIKVGGHTYQIEYVNDLVRDDNQLGVMCWQLGKLRLEARQSGNFIASTFLHEILHAIDRHYNSRRLSEEDTDRLSEGLFQVLSDMGITFER